MNKKRITIITHDDYSFDFLLNQVDLKEVIEATKVTGQCLCVYTEPKHEIQLFIKKTKAGYTVSLMDRQDRIK